MVVRVVLTPFDFSYVHNLQEQQTDLEEKEQLVEDFAGVSSSE